MAQCFDNTPSLHAGTLPPGDNLIIGLNPPFGKDGRTAASFVAHAARNKPRLIDCAACNPGESPTVSLV